MRLLLCVLLGFACAAGANAQETAGDSLQEDLIEAPFQGRSWLEVFINGQPTGLVATFTITEGLLLLPRDQYEGIGLVLPEEMEILGSDEAVVINELPGFDGSIDYRLLIIDLQVPAEFIRADIIDVQPRVAAMEAITGTGFLLGYDVVGNTVDPNAGKRETSLASLFDARAFSEWGILRSNTLLRSDAPDDGDQVVRLETNWTYDDEAEIVTYRVGDSVTGGLGWSRSVRYGGFQVERDFGIRPDIVTLPLQEFYGNVQAPSRVDLFVNGLQRTEGRVDGGPFTITDLPLNTGVNTVTVTTTDAFGREVAVESEVYVGPQLLASGLTDFSAETGLLREGLGEQSFLYATPFGSGTVRHGVDDWLTMQGHIEAAEDLFLLGTGAAFLIANVAEAEIDLAASASEQGEGGLVSASLERQADGYAIGFRGTMSSQEFADLVSLAGSDYPLRQLTATAGYNFGDYGSAGLSLADTLQRDDSRSRNLSMNYSVQLWKDGWFIASLFNDLIDRSNRGFSLNLSFPLGDTETGNPVRVNTGLRHQPDDTSLYSEFSQDNGEDAISWRAAGRTGDFAAVDGEVAYDGSHIDARVRAEEARDQRALEAEVAGALVYMDGGVFLADEVDDSFAVVQVPGMSDVDIFRENRFVGTTDDDGFVFVNELGSYGRNRISLDVSDIPLDAAIDSTHAIVVPRRNSGALVVFEARQSRSAIIVIEMPDGDPAPLGATVLIEGLKSSVVGYDGETYLTDLEEEVALELSVHGDYLCKTSFSVVLVAGQVPRLGPFTCLP
jgi:outer membrane usher protein